MIKKKLQASAIKVLLLILALGMNSGVQAQLAEEGMNDLGKRYKIFIYEKRSLGRSKWLYQTKTVSEGKEKPYFSDWQTADCTNSTIDGKVIKAISGGRWNEDGILKAVCGVR